MICCTPVGFRALLDCTKLLASVVASRCALTAAAAATSAPAHWQAARHLSTLPSLSSWHFQGIASSRPFSSSAGPSLTPGLEGRLEAICNRHSQLVAQLGTEEASSLGHADMARLNKELAELEPVVEAVAELNQLREEIAGLTAMGADGGEDAELRRMAQEEREAVAAGLPALEQALLLSLLPRDEADARGVVLEVRAGTGGDEACLFAAELFRMYERYAAVRGWRFDVAELSSSDLGGCKLASASIAGDGAYGRLKFESGVHRVQRVPATESGGRLHTSAASVAVLPEAGEVDVEVRDEDLRIDVYRAGGAGGQHVNTTNSAVRVTHLPTGLAVAIQDERSQHKNKAKALKVLRARLFDAERRRRAASLSKERRGQMGSGDRSERVRTYNFAQGRVTDHRVGVTEHGIEAVMAGERLDSFIEALRLQHQADLLASLDTGGGAAK